MNTEYEIRILEVNPEEFENQLKKLGAQKVGDWFQKRYVYDLKPVRENQWIRLRTNGVTTTVTYKNIVTDQMDGTKEIEVEVSDFELMNSFLKEIGFMPRNYQENKRIQYVLNGVEISIDSWPLIPPYVELEAKDEQTLQNVLACFEVDSSKITSLGCKKIYEKYGLDVNSIKELKFPQEKSF